MQQITHDHVLPQMLRYIRAWAYDFQLYPFPSRLKGGQFEGSVTLEGIRSRRRAWHRCSSQDQDARLPGHIHDSRFRGRGGTAFPSGRACNWARRWRSSRCVMRNTPPTRCTPRRSAHAWSRINRSVGTGRTPGFGTDGWIVRRCRERLAHGSLSPVCSEGFVARLGGGYYRCVTAA
jgi:hypothetical protein